jgi:hypothetical protein
MNRAPFNKTGLETLLTPENSAVTPIIVEHAGATGTSFLWEQQLLGQTGSNRR